ncbi:MAG: hypothetical protein HRU20_17725 [Pseudomonadales bacterium]|nr:hypothetical protein [Pseudomonadales bacterium]
MNSRLEKLSDLLTQAHHQIQQTFTQLNPVIGVRQNLRQSGFPADLITIDCLSSNKRIFLLLNDNQPDTLGYQMGLIDSDPDMAFNDISFENINSELLFNWMKDYFLNESHA